MPDGVHQTAALPLAGPCGRLAKKLRRRASASRARLDSGEKVAGTWWGPTGIWGLDMAIGPVQLIVLGFNHPDFHGEVIAEPERLRASDTVRVIHSIVVYKDADGEPEIEHLSNLTEQEAIELGSNIGALIGLGIEGEEGAVVGGIRRRPASPPVGGFRPGAERHRRDALRPGPPVLVADHHRLDTVAPGRYAPRMADTVMFNGIVDTTDAGSGRRSRPATS